MFTSRESKSVLFVYLRYCPLCKNDNSEVVLAGEKLKASKKKSKMASASGKSTRDWGKVMLIFHVYYIPSMYYNSVNLL